MSSQQVGSIHYSLDLDTSKFDRASERIKAKTKAIGDKMSSVGKSMTVGLTLPIAVGAGIAVKAASDLNENINKVGVAFKKSAKDVMNWSKTSIKNMGLAQSSALDAAALFGDMGTSMGLTTKEAAKMSMSMVQLGADLASFKNISFEEAQTALAGVFTGETESLKRLGIVMTEVNLEEFARAKGINKTMKEMSQGEKVQLRYQYIMSKTANAQGDFIRTGGGTANQIRITQEKFKQLSATLGAQLLPIANQVLGVLQKFMDKIAQLTPRQQKWLLIIAGIAAALGPLLLILGKMVTVIGALIPLLANPVFLVVAAVLAALAGVAYLIYKNWSTIKPIVDKVAQSFAGVAAWITQDVLPALKNVWLVVKDQLMAAWRDLKAALVQVMVAIQPYMPQLKSLAQVIAIVVVGAIVVFVAALAGLIVVIARVIGWLAKGIAWFLNFSNTIKDKTRSAVNTSIDLIGKLISVIASLPQRSRNAVGNLGHVLYNAGKSLIQGFINGVKDMWGGMVNTISNAASTVKNKFKSMLGIHSPSKVFTQYGRNITQGLVNGIGKGEAMVNASINRLANGNVKMPMVGAMRQNGSTTNSTKIYGNVNIGSQQDADYFFNRIDKSQNLASMGLAGSV